MARRKKESFAKKLIGSDPVYGSDLVQKLINVVMDSGKKNVARRIVYGALDVLVKKSNGDRVKALDYFNRSFGQIVPAIEVRARRVGGGVYQIPREVPYNRARALAMRWLIDAAAERPGKTMDQRLANELLDAYEGRGAAVKKKMDVHRMAEANRAFSHYAW
jgi:small subunit ribosomal protein S7